ARMRGAAGPCRIHRQQTRARATSGRCDHTVYFVPRARPRARPASAIEGQGGAVSEAVPRRMATAASDSAPEARSVKGTVDWFTISGADAKASAARTDDAAEAP